MKKSAVTIFVLFFIIAAMLISGCSSYGGQQTASPSGQQAQPPSPSAAPSAPSAAKTIEITASGFSPSTLTIKAGDTVAFVNKDTTQHWPASAMHPIHTVYPETGGCIGSKFDACKGLAAGETFEFTFTHVGSWKYHDHLNPSLWGTIVVQ